MTQLNQKFPSKLKLFIRRLNHYIFGEKFYKSLNYDWHTYSKRFDIINKIIKLKKYNSYLEIGCQSNENFSKVKIKKIIGVDPNDGGSHRMTSDQFFSQNRDYFDLIFIDGLHEYKQVKKDIYNSLNFLKKDGVILIHDCLPSKIWHQTIPQTHPSWNGDVWKALVECRTDLNIDTYTCVADHGIGVIFKRKNLNPLEVKISNFHKLKFKDYYTNHIKFMNLITENQLYELVKSYNHNK